MNDDSKKTGDLVLDLYMKDDIGLNTPKSRKFKYVVRSITVKNWRSAEEVEKAIQDELAYFVVPVRIVSVLMVHQGAHYFGVGGGSEFLLVIEGQA